MLAGNRLDFRRFLLVAATTVAAAAALWVGLFVFQLGALLPADYWIRDATYVKVDLAERARGTPRILLLAGSGTLFGIDSGMLEAETGRRTINLATHGGLRADYLFQLAGRVAEPGDVILAPLEPNLIQMSGWSEWFLHQTMTWGSWYFESLPPTEKLRFVFRVKPSRMVAGALYELLEDRLPEPTRRARSRGRAEVVAAMERQWAVLEAGTEAERPVFRDLDRHGDLRSLERDVQFQYFPGGYLAGDSDVHPAFARRYARFEREMRQRDVRVVLLWPATMTDEAFDLGRPADRAVVAAFERNMDALGFDIVGSAADFHYPRDLFLDSNFHLTPQGRTVRTRALIRVLRREMPELFAPPPPPGRPVRSP